jgi:hypothetical protein
MCARDHITNTIGDSALIQGAVGRDTKAHGIHVKEAELFGSGEARVHGGEADDPVVFSAVIMDFKIELSMLPRVALQKLEERKGCGNEFSDICLLRQDPRNAGVSEA